MSSLDHGHTSVLRKIHKHMELVAVAYINALSILFSSDELVAEASYGILVQSSIV